MTTRSARAGLAAILTSLVVACGPATSSITFVGQVQPPGSAGIPQPAATPDLSKGTLWITTLAGTLGQEAHLLDATGDFQFDLRTDNLPQASQTLRVQYVHPTRDGVLLQRDVVIAKGQVGSIDGDLTPLSTLAALAFEAATQLAPAKVPTSAAGVENVLIGSSEGVSLLTRFQRAYYAYLAGGATPPGADPDLAQDAMEIAFP